MEKRNRAFTLIAALTLGLAVLGFTHFGAHAQSKNEFRAAGIIGEGNDGYMHLRQDNAAARSLVNAVNGRRRSVYLKRAGQQGASADQVGRLYSPEIIKNAPPGTWFQNEGGAWARK